MAKTLMINCNAIWQGSGCNHNTVETPDQSASGNPAHGMVAHNGNNLRKRKIDLIEGIGFFDRNLTKIPKRSPGKIAIPKIAHVIWLSGESAGSAPSQRMLNIISLTKQLSAEGWHVKLWTNKTIVIERALSEIRLSRESPYRGLQLETGTKLNHQAAGKGIEICSDKNLFSVLESINQKSYENACHHEQPRNVKEACHYAETSNKYDLPLLFIPEQASNDHTEYNAMFDLTVFILGWR